MEKKEVYSVEQLHQFMEDWGLAESVLEEQDMLGIFNHWCQESPEMSIEEIIEEFFYHYELVESE